MIRTTSAVGWVVEARAGSLARVEGSMPPAEAGQIDMAAWQQLVAEAAATRPMPPVRLVYGGGANLITGYRLYYLLQFAKRAGVRELSLYTDGAFWIDEATDWLIESEVDEIVVCVPDGQLPEALADRLRDLSARTARHARRPRVDVRAAAPGVMGVTIQ